MKVPRSLQRSSGAGPRLSLIALAAVTIIAASLWFALRGPDARAGAVVGALAALASTTAALTALHLSRQSLARTDQQLAHARLVTTLSRRPLLLPVHQSVTFPDSSGTLAAHPPTMERFKLNPPPAGVYAFVADTNSRFLIPIENAGEGPALKISGELWHHSGARGRLVGPTAVGAGRIAIFSATISEGTDELPQGFLDAIRTAGAPDNCDRYWLETGYCDVFSNALTGKAFFDSRGLGRWEFTSTDAPSLTYA